MRDREEQQKINESITAPNVRLVSDDVEPGIYSTEQALSIAKGKGLDLVQVADGRGGEPPVCKIMDLQKFLFEKKKKQKQLKANSTKVVVKEIRMTPGIDSNDFEVKKDKVLTFLKKGAKVKVVVPFRGRLNSLSIDKGRLKLLELAQHVMEYGKLEQNPVEEGRRMFIFISPKKKK